MVHSHPTGRPAYARGVTIHREHPFLEPEESRDAVRRLRGRVGGVVSLWTAGAGADRAGLTVSSFLVATGDPGVVVGSLDPDAELTERLTETGRAVVQLLRWKHRDLADAFGGVAPAPGGAFRLGDWEDTPWGPRLASATTWVGVRLLAADEAGWSTLARCAVEAAGIGEEAEPLVHRRGRYVRP